MKTFHRSIKFILIVCFIIVACEKDDKPVISEDPILLAELLNSSTDTIEIGPNKLILKTYLQRDFMPSIPSSGKHPLIASVRMTDIDSVQISSDLDISKVYVIKENSIWISIPKNLTNSNTSNFILKRVCDNGPEWETNIYVDVVIEITSKSSNNKYLLISKHQYIDKTS
jgi:hypothetical protein